MRSRSNARLLKPLRQIADAVIDTSHLNVHQLRRQVITDFGLATDDSLSLLFESFAYKRGVPPDADFVFDARVPAESALESANCGRSPAVTTPVRAFLETQPDVNAYVDAGAAISSTPGCRGCVRTRAAT